MKIHRFRIAEAFGMTVAKVEYQDKYQDIIKLVQLRIASPTARTSSSTRRNTIMTSFSLLRFAPHLSLLVSYTILGLYGASRCLLYWTNFT